jgi:hypothetical protein
VSHISNFTVESLRATVCVKNAAAKERELGYKHEQIMKKGNVAEYVDQ